MARKSVPQRFVFQCYEPDVNLTLSEHYPGTMLSNSSGVNGNLYPPTSEEMGIMQIPKATCIEACYVHLKAVQIWNHHAQDKSDIFYKLTAYFNGDWKSNSNI
ncbi:hypothetical protein IW261DRAFT_1424833 [Armillaria novae-zelandiae]|uniref:Uncharacterized protein n=1 Tax=Armillaria novae-zelandiae TaxID=153914 RepID=A0AA39U6H2_9AGAR|nr:hypothetical protein IW261DRAFT_1424833 [Armillaria novae-zelandiae]